jgi:hypothetical protein
LQTEKSTKLGETGRVDHLRKALVVILVAAASIGGVAQLQSVVIHAIDGRNGNAITHQRLVVWEWDSQGARQLTKHIDLQTDGEGSAVLQENDTSVSKIQVWVDFHILCQPAPNGNSYSLHQIRTEGLSTANDCGSIVHENAPNSFVVFARPAHWWEKLGW